MKDLYTELEAAFDNAASVGHRHDASFLTASVSVGLSYASLREAGICARLDGNVDLARRFEDRAERLMELLKRGFITGAKDLILQWADEDQG